jgi:pimeloyl-ACP methyl ester carboxylesterase
MPTAHVNGIDVEYLTEGQPDDPALLLVMGLGAQLTAWPQGFVDLLCDRGFFVIRFDNRDCGLSTALEGTPDFVALFDGDGSSAPYRVEDMADDAAGLLRDLGATRTHVVGASMGGMITQALVINHPELFASACSIMSTTGDRSVGAPTGEAMGALLRPPATSREEAIDESVEGSKVIGSPGYPTDEAVRGNRSATGGDPRFARPYRGSARRAHAVPRRPRRGRPPRHHQRRACDGSRRGRITAPDVPGHGPRPSRSAVGTRQRRHRGQHGTGCGLTSQSSSALAAATEANQAALGLGVLANVVRSTLTRPNRGR